MDSRTTNASGRIANGSERVEKISGLTINSWNTRRTGLGAGNLVNLQDSTRLSTLVQSLQSYSCIFCIQMHYFNKSRHKMRRSSINPESEK